jgi:hypothetical protein
MLNQIDSENNPWRKKVVSCALAYADHIWKPTYKISFTDMILIEFL